MAEELIAAEDAQTSDAANVVDYARFDSAAVARRQRLVRVAQFVGVQVLRIVLALLVLALSAAAFGSLAYLYFVYVELADMNASVVAPIKAYLNWVYLTLAATVVLIVAGNLLLNRLSRV